MRSEAIRKLNGHTLNAAVDGFLSTVATIKRMDLGQAVEEFIRGRAHKIKSENGKRPQLSASYAYIVAMWLREFAKTFPGTAVCDLTKELLNAYMASHSDVTARTRNGRRSVVGMFLKWCVRQDYLAAGHRLLEANDRHRKMWASNPKRQLQLVRLLDIYRYVVAVKAGKKPELPNSVTKLNRADLCALGAYRLLESGLSINEAQDYTDTVPGKALFADKGDWSRAKKTARAALCMANLSGTAILAADENANRGANW